MRFPDLWTERLGQKDEKCRPADWRGPRAGEGPAHVATRHKSFRECAGHIGYRGRFAVVPHTGARITQEGDRVTNLRLSLLTLLRYFWFLLDDRAIRGYTLIVRDRLTKARRSWNMGRIRGKDTTPEKRVRSRRTTDPPRANPPPRNLREPAVGLEFKL